MTETTDTTARPIIATVAIDEDTLEQRLYVNGHLYRCECPHGIVSADIIASATERKPAIVDTLDVRLPGGEGRWAGLLWPDHADDLVSV